jgi:hypothetical protein
MHSHMDIMAAGGLRTEQEPTEGWEQENAEEWTSKVVHIGHLVLDLQRIVHNVEPTRASPEAR